MAKPTYDKVKDESRHAAVSKDDCLRMEARQGWRLKTVEASKVDSILKVDCVFEGDTKFPESFNDGEKDND